MPSALDQFFAIGAGPGARISGPDLEGAVALPENSSGWGAEFGEKKYPLAAASR